MGCASSSSSSLDGESSPNKLPVSPRGRAAGGGGSSPQPQKKGNMMEVESSEQSEQRTWSLDEIIDRTREKDSGTAPQEAAPVKPLSASRLQVATRLRDIPFFNMHSFRQIKQIAGAMQEVTVAPNQDVFRKDEPEDFFYVLRDPADISKLTINDGSGAIPAAVHVHVSPSSADSLGPAGTNGSDVAPSTYGETGASYFGEMCLRYHNVKRRYRMTCTGPDSVVLLRISPSEYRSLIVQQAKQQESQYMHFLRKVPILEGLTEEQLQALGRSLRHAKFPAGTNIITQGSTGSTFYFVESGTVKCVQRTQKGPNEVVQEVNRYTAGGYFGEGALLQDARRNADVVAVDDVSCLALHRQDFNDLLGGIQQLLEHNFRARVLKGVDLLRTLTDAERSELADLLVEQVFEPGEQILQQGDAGDRFYIIKEGEVRFTRNASLEEKADGGAPRNGRAESELLEKRPSGAADPPQPPAQAKLRMLSAEGGDSFGSPLSSPSSASGAAPAGGFWESNGSGSGSGNGSAAQKGDQHEEIGRLFTGQYFGEGALLTDAPRRASAYAVGPVTLLSLERSMFSRVFDQSLQDMLNRNFEKRRKESEAAIEFSDLEQIKVLGAGSYGQVLLVNNKVTGKTYALKCMSKQRIVAMKQQKHVLNEKAILEVTAHPFIVSLKHSYVSDEYVFVLLEAVLGGELFAYMRAAGRLKLKDAIFYMAQVILVFEYLHSHNIIYRDLKPENLLVAGNGYLKFTDFGLSKVLLQDRKTYTLCGTPAYAAPEIYNLSGHGKASDWWTLGVLTHELLSGTTPFDGDAEEIFASMEEYARAYPNIRLPRGLGGDVGDFVLRLLNPNQNKRLGCLPRGSGARDVKLHSLFKGYSWNKLIQEQTKAPFKPAIASGFDTKNFYNPVVKGQPVQLANVDGSKVKIAADWTF